MEQTGETTTSWLDGMLMAAVNVVSALTGTESDDRPAKEPSRPEPNKDKEA